VTEDEFRATRQQGTTVLSWDGPEESIAAVLEHRVLAREVWLAAIQGLDLPPREIAAGLLSVRHVAVEDFELLPGEPPFDLAFAIRVGALDGRHPRAGVRARQRIAAALTPTGRLFTDGGDPLRPVDLRNAGGTPERRPNRVAHVRFDLS
jgi:hypothetical protein